MHAHRVGHGGPSKDQNFSENVVTRQKRVSGQEILRGSLFELPNSQVSVKRRCAFAGLQGHAFWKGFSAEFVEIQECLAFTWLQKNYPVSEVPETLEVNVYFAKLCFV